jgi:hypothetical protein
MEESSPFFKKKDQKLGAGVDKGEPEKFSLLATDARLICG